MSAELRLEDLRVVSGDGRVVVAGSARFSDVTVVLGASGAGKSALAWALVDLLPPGLWRTGGEAWLDERPLWPASSSERPLRIVPQDPDRALNGRLTLARHMALAWQATGRRASPDEIRQAFERWRFPRSRIEALPGQLSGGELRRAALALAMVAEPRALILDEPTVGLDAEVAQQIETEALRPVAASGRLVILLTHDLFLARRLARRVVVVQEGALVECADAPAFWAEPRSEAGAAMVRGLARSRVGGPDAGATTG